MVKRIIHTSRHREKMSPVTKANPCPVCAGDHKCSVGDAGLIICGRRSGDEPGFRYLGASDRDPQFHLFRREDDFPTTTYHSRPSPPDTGSDRNWSELAADFAKQFTSQQAQLLAQRLGLPVEVFEALPLIGYSSEKDFYSFPEVDAKGTVIGITRRFRNGDKRAIKGSKRGLSIPIGWQDRPGPVYLVEGPSDTLAMTAARLSAIGRPSNTGGGQYLAELLQGIPKDRDIVVVGENDLKESGQWPGKEGAERVAAALAEKLNRPIQIAFPPEESKDVRAWLTANIQHGKTWIESGPELSNLLQSVASKISPPPGVELPVNAQATALEDAERAVLFKERDGQRVRYVADWGCFVFFDGQRWLKNPDSGRVIDLCTAPQKLDHFWSDLREVSVTPIGGHGREAPVHVNSPRP